MTDPFYILSIDGGGFRGLFAAHLLQRIEEEWSVDWHREFDMFAGTSTGSILAAGISSGKSAADIADLYREHGPSIFTPRSISRADVLKIFASRYDSGRLRRVLNTAFGETKLRDVSIPLLIPAVDIGNGSVHLFKSRYDDGFVRDHDVRLADAVLASCSAPTYFDPHVLQNTYRLVDGGLWANNPSLVATIDAVHRLGVHLKDIRVLSIGTGTSRTHYPRNNGWWKDTLFRNWQGWGFATRWQRTKLVDLILNLQSETAHNMLSLLLSESALKPQQVCRLTFMSDERLPMDSARKATDWISRADHAFSHNATNIRSFLFDNRDEI